MTTPPAGPGGGRGPREMREHDAMICRSCGREERASEGYPCRNCGTFVCLPCTFRGVELCAKCAVELGRPQPVN